MSTPTTKLQRHGDTMRGALNWSGTDFAGLTIQTLTTTQRDALSPSNGAVIYNSTDGKFQGYQAGSWVTLASEAFVTAAEGSDWKQSCQLATTANITLSGEQTIDGVTTSSSRVLVKNQSTGSENGIYVSASGAWSRASDADEDGNVTSGMTTYIEQGSTLAKTAWQLTTADPITLGTTTLQFEEFDPATGSAITQSEPSTGNMLVGTGAGSALSGASYNTFLGQQAGNTYVAQNYDTLVGYRAGGGGITLHSTLHRANVMMGYEAGYNSTGGDNVCLGMTSQFGGTSSAPSQNNVIVGRNAGYNMVGYQCSQNTFVGESAGPSIAGACNYTTLVGWAVHCSPGVTGSLGINGDVTADNQAVIGGSNTSNYVTDVYFNSVENATVHDCTLHAGGASGTDIAGADLGIAAGKATGNAAGGTLYFKTAVAGVSGTTLQSLQDRMRIDDEGRVHIGWSGTEVAPSSGYCFQVHANTASAWGAYVYNDLGEGLRVATAASDKAALWASRAGSTADGNYTIRGQATGTGGDTSTVPVFQAYRSNGGTPAAGFGSSFQFYAHNAAATDHFQGAIDCAWTDATDTSEDSKFEFYTAVASAKTLALTIDGTKTQAVSMLNSPELEQTLSDGATINWDMNSGGVGIVTLGGNRALAAPTNIKNGARYILHVIQDGTGTRTLSFNAVFKWAGGTAPTLSTGGGDIDVFEFQARGGNLYEVSQKLNLS